MKKFLSLIVLSLLMMTGLAWAQGLETFANLGITGTTYQTADFLGQDGSTWSFVKCRGDKEISGKAITIGKDQSPRSYFQSGEIAGGIGQLYFKYMQAESNNVDLYVYIMQEEKEDKLVASVTTDNEKDVVRVSGIIDVEIEGTFQFKFINRLGGSGQVCVDDIQWTGFGGSFSELMLSIGPPNLNGFCYTEGAGPSAAKSFIVNGSNLEGDIELSVQGDFKIALSEDGPYDIGLTLSRENNAVDNTRVFVIMLSELDKGLHSGSVIVSTDGINDMTVELNGEVYDFVSAHCYFVTFEGKGETKGTYTSETIKLSTRNWNMTKVLIGTDDIDWKKGLRSARLQGHGDSSMSMLEDKPNGLGTLSFLYRRYGSDTQVDWKAEYSKDQGGTWIQIGEVFTAPSNDTVKEFRETVNVPGDVRIRIKRATETGTDNKRLNIDNILMTRYLEYDYNTGIPEETDIGTVTFTAGYANNITNPDMPTIPNTSIGENDYKILALDLVENGSWAIEVAPPNDYAFCAYNWQGEWYDAQTNNGVFKITVNPTDGDSRDLFIVLANDNPTFPVELSSFLVMLNKSGMPILTWETQTETGVNGFYIYRSMSKNLNDAIVVSSLIPATNSSLAHSYSFVDTDIYEDGTYYYWLNVSDLNGHESYHGPAELDYSPLDNGASGEVPYNTGFKSIYPNPFNPSANIAFGLAEAGEVCISVYNVRGQLVRNFAPFTHDAGYGSIVWNGKDDGGNSVSSGLYFFRMKIGAKIYNIKALMLK